MAKHTRGPWIALRPPIVQDDYLQWAVGGKDDRDYICYVSSYLGMPAEANAELLARAPILKEALEDVLKLLRYQETDTSPEASIYFRAKKALEGLE